MASERRGFAREIDENFLGNVLGELGITANPTQRDGIDEREVMLHQPGESGLYRVAGPADAGIASTTSTCIELLGLTPPPDLAPSLLAFDAASTKGGGR